MDWTALHRHRHASRGAQFYVDCLQYGQTLWQRRQAARAILCLDRAFGADLRGDESVLVSWPLPYSAMAWLLKQTPPDLFLGNPRVHFQHYADRMNEPRREQRRWRAWACWSLTRVVLPHLPADARHDVREPDLVEIASALRAYGHPREEELWNQALYSTRTDQ